MKNIHSTIFLAVAALAPVTFAQGPAGDRVRVTIDRPVQVGSQTLPAGDYTIRQVTSASNPRVVEFTSHDGTKLEATATAVPILQNSPPSETKVIIEDEGSGARLSRIWVQGKSYGYEFPGKGSLSANASNTVSLQGKFEANRPAEALAQQQPAEPTPAPAPAPAQVAQNEAPAAAAEPAPQPQSPAPAPAAEPQTPAPAANTTPMPATALGWVQLMLLGLMISAAGFALYWRAGKGIQEG